MSKSKEDRFKIGDILTRKAEEYQHIPFGTEVYVLECDLDGLPFVKWLKGNEWFDSYVDDNYFELHELCKSPLWKALA